MKEIISRVTMNDGTKIEVWKVVPGKDPAWGSKRYEYIPVEQDTDGRFGAKDDKGFLHLVEWANEPNFVGFLYTNGEISACPRLYSMGEGMQAGKGTTQELLEEGSRYVLFPQYVVVERD